MPAIKDIRGIRFARLVVESKAEGAYWNCVCDCGKRTTVQKGSLTHGKTRSCGCLRKDTNSKHGLSEHPCYDTWRNMMRRCYNPKSKDFKNYHSRGITVCERWHNVLNFIDDLPPRPNGTFSLDRIDNDKGYEPGNVRWATPMQQSNNQHTNVAISIASKTMNLSQWARFIKISNFALRQYAKRHKLSLTMTVKTYLDKRGISP